MLVQTVQFMKFMYYLTKGLQEKGFVSWENFSSYICFLCIGASFGGGNAAQSNQAAMQLVFFWNDWWKC